MKYTLLDKKNHNVLFLGVIRDITKSFPICLHSQTFLIMLCCIAWLIEYTIVYCKNKSRNSETESETTTT